MLKSHAYDCLLLINSMLCVLSFVF